MYDRGLLGGTSSRNTSAGAGQDAVKIAGTCIGVTEVREVVAVKAEIMDQIGREAELVGEVASDLAVKIAVEVADTGQDAVELAGAPVAVEGQVKSEAAGAGDVAVEGAIAVDGTVTVADGGAGSRMTKITGELAGIAQFTDQVVSEPERRLQGREVV